MIQCDLLSLFHYDISGSTAKPEEDDSGALVSSLGKNVRHILTEDLRAYLTECQGKHQSSRVTIDKGMPIKQLVVT